MINNPHSSLQYLEEIIVTLIKLSYVFIITLIE